MEPSFWSWEKLKKDLLATRELYRRNGAQLLELGKVPAVWPSSTSDQMSQWSPAFGAGKRARDFFTN